MELGLFIENGVKSVGMIIGEKEPTIIPPNLYKKRFRLSMDSYFITVVEWRGAAVAVLR